MANRQSEYLHFKVYYKMCLTLKLIPFKRNYLQCNTNKWDAHTAIKHNSAKL
jgi:hypothetical protein